MTTFVIVHGAWSGAHAWRWVRPLLRAGGHEVVTPSLTGLGERSHLARPEVGLATHVDDVVATLYYEDLSDVVLVGHSYGGMVIAGVADRVPERIAQLIYLDADVPLDGESERDLMPEEEWRGYAEAAATRGDGWRVPPPFPDPLPPGLPPPVAWAIARMVPHPLATMTQPLRLSAPDGSGPPRTYVICTEGKDGQPVPAHVQRVEADPDWHVVRLAAAHSAHVLAPELLAETLVGLPAGHRPTAVV
jgi:pimeloyl-ACP methyl ester carboxylesterase